MEAFLSAYMSYQTDNYWVGLSDTQTAGTYKWISGGPVTYSNWVQAHTGKDCLSVRRHLCPNSEGFYPCLESAMIKMICLDRHSYVYF